MNNYVLKPEKIILSILIGLLLNISELYSSKVYQNTAYIGRVIALDTIPSYIFSDEDISIADVVIDHSFMPIVFTGKVLPDGYLKKNPYQLPKLSNIDEIVPNNMVLDTTPIFSKELLGLEIRRKAYLYMVTINPEMVKYSLSDFPEEMEEIKQLEVNPFSNLFRIENPDLSLPESPEKFQFRKYWFINGNHLLKFSQNYISDNWYKGGVGNLNILSNENIKLSYIKNKVRFNTYLEWNVSLYTNPNDTLRKTRIGTDLLRSYSDFGFEAFGKQWFYSTNLELKTQIFDNYRENTKTKISTFMSPFFLNMGILGMRYELDKKFKENKYKSLKFSSDFSPLSVKYTYVGNKDVDPTRYGIPAGKDHLLDLGSTINANITFKINRSTSFKSRFKYFTDYDKMEIESENEIDFSINRYFSTQIYLYLRYDDGENVPRDSQFGHLQINQLLSFGFNYKW